MIQRLELSYLQPNIDITKVWKPAKKVSIPCYNAIEKDCIIDAIERCIIHNIYTLNINNTVGIPTRLYCASSDGSYIKFENNKLDISRSSNIDRCIRNIDYDLRISSLNEDIFDNVTNSCLIQYYSKNTDIILNRKIEIIIEKLFENIKVVYSENTIELFDTISECNTNDNKVIFVYSLIHEVLFSKVRTIVVLDNLTEKLGKELEDKLVYYIEKNKNVEQIFRVYTT